MPRIRRRPKARKYTITEAHLENLRSGHDFDGDTPFQGPEAEYRREAWELCREALMTEATPGTRPAGWWDYEAPEPRRRLGGTGTPIPGRGLHRGKPGAYFDDYSNEDPPRFESEEAYLARHGLLTPEETEELTHTQGDK